jgi:hypothetical protein
MFVRDQPVAIEYLGGFGFSDINNLFIYLFITIVKGKGV